MMREIRYLDKLIDELAKGKAWRRSSANNRALASSLAGDRGIEGRRGDHQ
jgi:hypothetical protein